MIRTVAADQPIVLTDLPNTIRTIGDELFRKNLATDETVASLTGQADRVAETASRRSYDSHDRQYLETSVESILLWRET